LLSVTVIQPFNRPLLTWSSRLNVPVDGIVKVELSPGVHGQRVSHVVGVPPQSIWVMVIVGGDTFWTKRLDAINYFLIL